MHERPYSDSARVVTLEGVTMTQDTSYWALPDRRNQDVFTTIQLAINGIAVAAMLVIHQLLRSSKLGKAMPATHSDMALVRN